MKKLLLGAAILFCDYSAQAKLFTILEPDKFSQIEIKSVENALFSKDDFLYQITHDDTPSGNTLLIVSTTLLKEDITQYCATLPPAENITAEVFAKKCSEIAYYRIKFAFTRKWTKALSSSTNHLIVHGLLNEDKRTYLITELLEESHPLQGESTNGPQWDIEEFLKEVMEDTTEEIRRELRGKYLLE